VIHPDSLPIPAQITFQPLAADRPDFTEATDTVAPGRVQIEGGITLAGSGSSRSLSFPEILVRIGVSGGIELRLAPPGIALNQHPHIGGWSDGGIGTKVRLYEGDSWAWSMIAQISLPTNESDFGSEEPTPEIKALWSVELSDHFSLAGNLNIAVPESGGWGRSFEPGASVSIGYTVTDRLGAYAEYFGIHPIGGESGSENYINVGLTYQFTPDFQIDARAGAGLTPASDDYFVGIGFAVRF
jgi:hypothetical protein